MVTLSWWCSFCGDFGDGGAGAGFVDDRFLAGVGGDEGLDSAVVHRLRQASGDLVDQSERVIAEQRVGSAGQLQVMAHVGSCLLVVHPGYRVTQRDALVKGGESAELDPPPQRGLPDQ